MCGLAAIYSYHRSPRPIDREELVRMSDAMASRGPDGEGFWVGKNKNIAFAHRRLAILDLSDEGTQPMVTPDGKLSIVFNGEIYNYRELRAKLKAKGYQFRSSGDTEVLLYAYRQYGVEMVHHLRGMFAFTIWDEDRRGLFLARDHFGIKPLYYHDDGYTFRATSQVKAMVAGRGFITAPEPAGHVGFFLWGSVPEPYTLYQNLFSLPAGHTLWVDENGPRVPQRYFDVTEELALASSQITQDVAVRGVFQDALRDSMQHHLIADVPVGVFLSSGVDSGSLMALASDTTPHINAVTLGFKEYEGTDHDETPLARKLADRYGCNHHIEQITHQDFIQVLPNILAAMDQPTIDGVNTWFVARAAANAGLKVALSGLGGDELLGGYPGFRQIPKLISYARFPAAIPGFGKGFRFLSSSLLKFKTSPKYAGIFEYGDSYGGAYLLRRSLFMPWELPEILDPDMAREGWETLQPVIRMDDQIANLSTPHARISALEFTQYMRNTLLRDSDWAGMAHSLEIRTPLVDVEVFRALAPYLAGIGILPSKQDMANTPTRPLPDDVVNRPKTGFSIPVQEWIESAGISKKERGLRGWGIRVYEDSHSPEYDKKNQRKRIFALVSDAFGAGGGIGKFNRDLLTATSASPKVSNVIALTRYQPNLPKNLPVKLTYNVRGMGRDFRSIAGKWNYIREAVLAAKRYQQIDLVLCGLISLLPLAYLVARAKRAPLWCVIHGIDAWQPHPSRLVNWIVRRADGVIAVSEVTKKRFVKWSGVTDAKVIILPNCYDPASFQTGPKPESLLLRYKLQGKIVIMTMGRLSADEQYKGFDEVMECLPALVEQVPNLAYIIVGKGDDKKRLQEKAKMLGIDDHVIFTGYIPESEKSDHYRLADAYVMPGRGEGFGIVYLEAMACGIPTVGSKLDGSRDALRNGQLGNLADPTNRDDVQNVVLQALSRERGVVPEGLDYFSVAAFRKRTFSTLDQIFIQHEKRG